MKPTGGRYQTATQVKGLSPVITNVKEVDSIHELEDNMIYLAMVRDRLLFRGLRPWYDIGWNLQELGRPNLFLCEGYSQTIRRGEDAEKTDWESD